MPVAKTVVVIIALARPAHAVITAQAIWAVCVGHALLALAVDAELIWVAAVVAAHDLAGRALAALPVDAELTVRAARVAATELTLRAGARRHAADAVAANHAHLIAWAALLVALCSDTHVAGWARRGVRRHRHCQG